MSVQSLVLLNRIAVALERIATQMEEPGEPFELPAVGGDDVCPHPKEAKVSLTGMGTAEEWMCGACGYHQFPRGLNG